MINGNQQSAISNQQFGLHVHVPFCSAICNYCNFNRGLFEAGLKARYVEALTAEIRKPPINHPINHPINQSTILNKSAISNQQSAIAGVRPAADTIYFGGGTPSLLEPDEIARIIRACDDAFDV